MKQPDNPYLASALASYPDLYRKVIQEWSGDGQNAIWLMYAANYLLRVGSTRLAIDPMTLPARLGGHIPETIPIDLAPAEVVLLSHDHSDHVNWKILTAISATVQQWIIPLWLKPSFEQFIPAPSGSVAHVQPGDTITFRDVRIDVHNGNHWEDRPYSRSGQSAQKGLPSLAFVIEGAGKKWLFAGDTRSFQPDARIPCGPIDAVMAHVFLGRLHKPGDAPPLLPDFCAWFSGYATNRIILSHLYEIGRDSKDIWTESHSAMIERAIHAIKPTALVESFLCGDMLPW